MGTIFTIHYIQSQFTINQLSWEQIQKKLSRIDLQKIMKLTKSLIKQKKIKDNHIRDAIYILGQSKNSQIINSQKSDNDMNLLCYQIQEAIWAIIHKIHENEEVEEKPQNLLVRMYKSESKTYTFVQSLLQQNENNEKRPISKHRKQNSSPTGNKAIIPRIITSQEKNNKKQQSKDLVGTQLKNSLKSIRSLSSTMPTSKIPQLKSPQKKVLKLKFNYQYRIQVKKIDKQRQLKNQIINYFNSKILHRIQIEAPVLIQKQKPE